MQTVLDYLKLYDLPDWEPPTRTPKTQDLIELASPIVTYDRRLLNKLWRSFPKDKDHLSLLLSGSTTVKFAPERLASVYILLDECVRKP